MVYEGLGDPKPIKCNGARLNMENKKAELKSIDEYIAQYPELQEKFQTLRRKAIIDAAPGARKERVGRCKPLR